MRNLKIDGDRNLNIRTDLEIDRRPLEEVYYIFKVEPAQHTEQEMLHILKDLVGSIKSEVENNDLDLEDLEKRLTFLKAIGEEYNRLKDKIRQDLIRKEELKQAIKRFQI